MDFQEEAEPESYPFIMLESGVRSVLLDQKFAAGEDGALTRDLEGGVAVETGFVEFAHHLRDAYDAVAKGNRRHTAAEDFSALGLHFSGHVFPVNVLDFGAKFPDVSDGVTSAEPEVSGVEVKGKGRGVAGVEDAFGEGDLCAHRAVGFEQNFDPEILRKPQGLVEFFPDAENLFVRRERASEGRVRFTFRGDDMLHSDECGGADGLDDLARAKTPWRGGIEQVGVGAPATDLQAVRGKLASDVVRIRIEARNGREAEFHPERSSVAVVGDVRIFEPPGRDLSELDVEY